MILELNADVPGVGKRGAQVEVEQSQGCQLVCSGCANVIEHLSAIDNPNTKPAVMKKERKPSDLKQGQDISGG